MIQSYGEFAKMVPTLSIFEITQIIWAQKSLLSQREIEQREMKEELERLKLELMEERRKNIDLSEAKHWATIQKMHDRYHECIVRAKEKILTYPEDDTRLWWIQNIEIILVRG